MGESAAGATRRSGRKLVVTGQHICENIPPDFDPTHFKDPLNLGLAVIWAGNLSVLALAVVLLVRLRRQ